MASFVNNLFFLFIVRTSVFLGKKPVEFYSTPLT
jgi:hypothetical protein